MSPAPLTVGAWRSQAADRLAASADAGSAEIEADMLLVKVMELERSQLYSRPERVITADQRAALGALLARRCSGEPLAYILESKGFHELVLKVDPRALVPRADTEPLVDWLLEHCDGRPRRVIDLGTGSGAIALALALARPDWQVLATDFSPPALALASENALSLGLPIQPVLADWLGPFDADSFDVIVSNPPYIDPADPHLDSAELICEPRSALVSADRGMRDLKLIIAEARRCLRTQGMIALEHGWDQAEAVAGALAAAGFAEIEVHRDNGGQHRFSTARKP